MNRKHVLSVILLSLISFTSNADTEVLKNDVQLVFMGVDPATHGLIFEGTSIGEYGSGAVKVLVFPYKLIDTQQFISTRWSFSNASGASITGASSGYLDLVTLDIRERGTVLTCFGELSHLCSCAFRFKGMASDSEFIPYVSTVHAQESITTVEGGDCIASDEDED